ncbi:MAG: flagellar basal body-associated FliL family protein [Kordiimonadaceae bacterium]|nr:flagellar basal body-associated FliL family protein [Kordiimonadaceae bacterium]
MADQGGLEEVLGEAELVEGLERKKLSGKKLVVAAGAGFIILLALVGGWVMFGGDDETVDNEDAAIEELAANAAAARNAAEAEQDKPAEELQTLFIDMGTHRYNLNVEGSGASFLQVKIVLEVDRESFRADVEAKMPRILDEFNVYMRELHPADLNGSKGMFRLKEELLMRVNQAVAPARVEDILIQEFLQQGN